MNRPNTQLLGIVLAIQGKRLELSIEEATALRSELNRVLPNAQPVYIPPYLPGRVYPNLPMKPSVTWGDSTATSEPPKPFTEITCSH